MLILVWLEVHNCVDQGDNSDEDEEEDVLIVHKLINCNRGIVTLL